MVSVMASSSAASIDVVLMVAVEEVLPAACMISMACAGVSCMGQYLCSTR